MVRFVQTRRRSILGVVVGALMLGASLLQSAEALAGFSTSPGTRVQPGALTRSTTCGGEHLPEATIAVR